MRAAVLVATINQAQGPSLFVPPHAFIILSLKHILPGLKMTSKSKVPLKVGSSRFDYSLNCSVFVFLRNTHDFHGHFDYNGLVQKMHDVVSATTFG